MLTVETFLSPVLFPSQITKCDSVVVVVDVLRATTAFCAALDRGFEAILPVAEVDEAKLLKKNGYMVAAEREGDKLDFADFGNSPTSFLAAKVISEKLVYTTTNGTQSIEKGKAADALVTASFSNLNAIAEWIDKQRKNISILCSGWKNNFSLEDTLCAGAIAEKLLGGKNFATHCDATIAAICLWKQAQENLPEFASQSSHYQRLLQKELTNDLSFCFRLNTSKAVPQLIEGYLVDAASKMI
jgi:2-phosphosulfolactate phosphatase